MESDDEGVDSYDSDEEEENEEEEEIVAPIEEIPAPIDEHHCIVRIRKPDERTTSDHLGDGEYAALVATRATQIENGSHIFTDYKGLTNPEDIARKEISERRCPLLVERKLRTLADGVLVEHWAANDMGLPSTQSRLIIRSDLDK